jgi:PadR family transcriptional regulator, regulatory protein AphA
MHGYEMARELEAEGLTEVCPVEQSLLYSYLRNLEERGLVRWEEHRVGGRPPRKQFELTGIGSQTVDQWLREPVQRLRDVRLAFLLKLYLLGSTDPDGERELLGRQIEVCEAYRTAAGTRVDAADNRFARLVAKSRLSAAEATLNWLREYAGELSNESTA